MKSLFVFILNILIFLSLDSHSQNQSIRTVNGKNYKVYHVESGDGWKSIAKKFSISYAELRVANKDSDDKLIIGEELLIPIEPIKSNDPYFNKNYLDKQLPSSSDDKYKYHKVLPSQTLYSISKLYSISIDEIKKWNNLSSNDIKIGQLLIVGENKIIKDSSKIDETKASENSGVSQGQSSDQSENFEPFVVAVPSEPEEIEGSHCDEPIYINREYNQYPSNEMSDSLCDDKKTVMNKLTDEANKEQKDIIKTTENTSTKSDNEEDKIVFANGRKEINEEGIAIWFNEEDSNPEKYYAYHKTAKTGTIIKVTNPSNAKSIFVKVIGTLSDKDCIIRISKASAERLGLSENKISVRLLYGISDDK